jgi:hypothetical protein
MNRKIAVLFSILVMSLAFTGISYAHWSKIMRVEGNLTTGTFHVTPYLENKYLGTYYQGVWEPQTKPVADWGPYTGTDTEDSNTIHIDLENVYPCLWTGFRVRLWNDGSIPAGLKRVAVKASEDSEDTFVLEEVVGSTEIPGYVHYRLLNVDCDDFCPPVAMDIFVKFGADPRPAPTVTPAWPDQVGNSFLQIDPGLNAWFDVIVHFDECLPQSTLFEFEVKMIYWNWNEVYNAGNLGAPDFVYNGVPMSVPIPGGT